MQSYDVRLREKREERREKREERREKRDERREKYLKSYIKTQTS
jgi:hypothetical protein